MWRTLRLVLLGAVAAVYVGLGYWVSSSSHPPLLAVLVGAAPVVLGMLVACWQSPIRYLATGACLAALLAVACNIALLLDHAAWLYFFQHAGTMVALGIMFGSTLARHETALCSRVAMVAIAQPLDAEYLHYTWKVTLAWTIYFALSAVISTGLFFGASREAWSLFAAVITPVSLPFMFAGEYLIRQYVVPGRPPLSIANTIRSYRNYTQRQRCAE